VTLTLLAGDGNRELATAVARCLSVDLGACTLERFPDSELHVALGNSVRGDDVFVIQPTGPPVDSHLLELAMLADACTRSGASRVTAVVPYFGYARQDRRTAPGEAVGAKVVAQLLAATRIERLIVVDPHSAALEPMSDVAVDAVSAGGILTTALRPWLPANGVVIAPDLGAVRLAERYAAQLDLPVAVVRKQRISGEAVRAGEVIGDVQGCVPILVDDMISSGATIEAAARAVIERGAEADVFVAASHGLFVGSARDRLAALPLRRVLVSDSVPAQPDLSLPIEVVGIASLLADVVTRLHEDRPLGNLALYR
jgi:ribose-phosphate pyrophosphokinase